MNTYYKFTELDKQILFSIYVSGDFVLEEKYFSSFNYPQLLTYGFIADKTPFEAYFTFVLTDKGREYIEKEMNHATA